MNEVRIYARFIPIRIPGDYVVIRMYTTDYTISKLALHGAHYTVPVAIMQA